MFDPTVFSNEFEVGEGETEDPPAPDQDTPTDEPGDPLTQGTTPRRPLVPWSPGIGVGIARRRK